MGKERGRGMLRPGFWGGWTPLLRAGQRVTMCIAFFHGRTRSPYLCRCVYSGITCGNCTSPQRIHNSCDSGISMLNYCHSWVKFVNTHLSHSIDSTLLRCSLRPRLTSRAADDERTKERISELMDGAKLTPCQTTRPPRLGESKLASLRRATFARELRLISSNDKDIISLRRHEEI